MSNRLMKHCFVSLPFLSCTGCVLLFLVLFVPQTHSAQITFAWDRNPEPDILGYRIYKTTTAGQYTFVKDDSYNNDMVWEGAETTATVTADDACFFVLTAVDTAENESDPSNELAYEPLPTHLESLAIDGPLSVSEGSTASFIATATFTDSTTQPVTTTASWSEDSPYASFGSPGQLTTSEVTTDQTVRVTVNYTSHDVAVTDRLDVTIINGDLPYSDGIAYAQDGGFKGLVSIEVEHHDAAVSSSTHEWVEVFPYNYSGLGAMEAMPNTGSNVNSGYVSRSPRLDFPIDFVKTGTHHVWARGIGTSGRDDSYHAGLDGAAVATSNRITGFGTQWTWSKSTIDGPVATIDVDSPGTHTLNVWMREDGFILDKVVITTDADYVPSGTGPEESPRVTPRVATPTIRPTTGTYCDSVTVVLETTTAEADIYFTLDGRDPTEASLLYTEPFVLGDSATVKARAFRSNYNESEIASADLTIAAGCGVQVYSQDSGPDGLVSIEAENYETNISPRAHDWVQTFESDCSGTGAMEAMPNTGSTVNSGYVSKSPRLDFPIDFVKTGTHHVWARGIGTSGRDDSYHAGLDGAAVTTSNRITGFITQWTWSKSTIDGPVATIHVDSPGIHTLNVWMREDGFILDKLVITTNSDYVPSGIGPEESSRVLGDVR